MKSFISSYQKNLRMILSVFALAFLCMSFFSIPTTEVSAESNFIFNNNLNIGSKLSPDVKELQTFLNNNGYNCGTLDGSFGPKTKQAVILFQTAKSLTPDGSVGPKTRASINGTSSVTAGCANGTNLFNTLTGKSCANNPIVSITGCTSGALFNTITGKSCAITTQPIVLLAGCTTTTIYSITTGLSCSTGLPPTTVFKIISGWRIGSHSKVDVSAPSAPTLASKTTTSITLVSNALNEFSIDSGSTWQDSNVFNGLTASTSYTFTARVKATSTTNASLASVSSASITTEAGGLTNDYLWIPKAGSTIVTVGLTLGGYYQHLGDVVFDINNGLLMGDIVAQIIESDDFNSPEILYENGWGGTSSYTSLTIYPTVPNITITTTNDDGSLLTLDGADNVTIDGRVNRTGTTPSLTFVNTGTGNKTIEFVNTPENTNVIYSNGINESLVQWTPLAGSVTYTVGTDDPEFQTIQNAFTYINDGNTAGDIVFQMTNSTVENYDDGGMTPIGKIVLDYTNFGLNYNTLVLYPTAPGLIINGNYIGYLMTFMGGVKNVTIDGRVNRTGSTPSLTITNTSPNGGEITFLNSPENSTVIYTNIQ